MTTVEIIPVADEGENISATKAWVFYGNISYGRASISEHAINKGVVGAAQWLDASKVREEIMSWQEREEEEISPRYLPYHILSSTSDSLVWFVPSSKRSLTFTAPALKSLSGKSLTVPSLVFQVKGSRLLVHAIRSSKCPALDSPLYDSPFPNMMTGGSVCTGTMEKHGVKPSDAEAWTDSFFESAFTHSAYVKYWKSVSKGEKPKLRPANLTLKDFIYEH